MNDVNKRFATDKPIKIKNEIIECSEQGRYCLKKFIPTRVGQTDTCIKCLMMLDDEIPAIKKSGQRSKFWK